MSDLGLHNGKNSLSSVLLQISLTGNNLNLLEAEWTSVGPLDCICCPFPATSQLLSTVSCNMPHDFSPLGSCGPVLGSGAESSPWNIPTKETKSFLSFIVCGKHCLCITWQKKWFGNRTMLFCTWRLWICCLDWAERALNVVFKPWLLTCCIWSRHPTSLLSSSLANWELQCLSCEGKIKCWV